jgi:tetratricopeptide (TPR) repeat protein
MISSSNTTSVLSTFYDLIETATSMNCIIDRLSSEPGYDKASLKAVSVNQLARAEEVKRKYNELINDLREEIADDVWNKKLSSIDQEFSKDIDKLIQCLVEITKNIEDKKNIVETIMLSILNSIRNLYNETFGGIKDPFQNRDPISDLNGGQDVEKILKLLKHISSIYSKNALNYARFNEYCLSAIEYKAIADAYRKAINIIENKGNAINEPLVAYLSDSVQHWESKSRETLLQGTKHEELIVAKHGHAADEYLSLSMYTPAIREFNKILKLKTSSDITEILIKKGNAYSRLKMYDIAVECYRDSIALRPSEKAWYNMGLCLIELNKYQDAITSFDEVLNQNKNDYLSWWGKGLCYFSIGDYGEAEKCFDNAITINRNEPTLWNNKGVICLTKSDYVNARLCYEKALKLKPDHILAKMNLAEVSLLNGEYDECKKWMTEVSESLEAGRYEFAIRLFDAFRLYFQDNIEEGRKIALDLVNYYESILTGSKETTDFSIGEQWNYDNLSKVLKRKDLAPEIKHEMTLLMSLVEKRNDNDKADLIRTIRKELESQRVSKGVVDTISSFLKVGKARESDIRVVNSSEPIENRKGWYNWKIHLDAPNNILRKIRDVTYILHPTFYEPRRTITKSNGGFKLEANGYGEFLVTAIITLKNNEKITKYHWLKLSGPTPLDTSS